MPKPTAKIRFPLYRLREALFKKFFRARFRYDVFISYSHRDAKEYAANLKRQLGDLDFSCFIDEEESPPGSSLDPTLVGALKKSAVFVLLATERALTRPYIALEFEQFATTARTIIPVNILGALTKNDGETLTKTPWNIIDDRKLVWIDETDEAFAKRNPSPAIADGIDKLFKYTRRNVRVRAEIIGTAVIVLLAAFGAVFAIKGKNAELAEQNRLLGIAKTQTETAQIEAKTQGEIAGKARNDAEAQLAIAKQAREDAEKAKKEAANQQELARRATEEAGKQQRLARDAELQTKRQLEFNRHLSYDSDMSLAQRAYESDDITRASQLMKAHLPAPNTPGQGDLRSFEWFYLWRLYNNEQERLSPYQGASAFSPRSHALAISNEKGDLILLDVVTRQEKVLVKGLGPLQALMFSPDGKLLITDAKDGVIKLWDLSTDPPKDLRTLRDALGRRGQMLHKTSGIEDIPAKFSGDGKTLAIPNGDTVTLWDTVEWKKRQTVKASSMPVVSPALSPDGKILILAGNSRVEFWDVSGNVAKEIEKLRLEANFPFLLDFSVAFSPDSKTLVTEDQNNSVRLWDLITNTPEQGSLLEKSKWHLFGSFTPQGDRLVLIDYNGNVEVWKIKTKQAQMLTVNLGKDVNQYPRVTFSPDGNTLAISKGNGIVKLVSLSTVGDDLRGEIATLVFSDGPATMEFSPDGRSFAALTSDGILKVWDLVENSEGVTQKALAASVSNFGFSPDSHFLVALSDDKSLRLWELNSAWLSPVSYHARFYVTTEALSSDNSTLAIGDSDGHVRMLNVHSLKEPVVLKGSSGDPIFYLAFSPDGKMLVGGGIRGGVQLWDITTADKDPKSLQDSGGVSIKSAIFSHAGDRVGIVDDSGTVKVWTISNLNTPVTFERSSVVSIVAFSREGNKLIARDREANVLLWDLERPKELKTLATHVNSVALSSDGKTMVTVNEEGQAKLWDTGSLQAEKTLDLHRTDFKVVAVSATDKLLATSGEDVVKLWDINTGQELLTLKTQSDWSTYASITSLTFSRDGNLLIGRIGTGGFTIWYAANRSTLISSKTSP